MDDELAGEEEIAREHVIKKLAYKCLQPLADEVIDSLDYLDPQEVVDIHVSAVGTAMFLLLQSLIKNEFDIDFDNLREQLIGKLEILEATQQGADQDKH